MAKRSTARKVTHIVQEWMPVPDALKALPLDALNGPGHSFVIEPCGWSGEQIEALLHHYGVQMWGRMVLLGKLMFTVRKRQARWAQYLLERNGVTIAEGTAYCGTLYKGGARPMKYRHRKSSLPAFIIAAIMLGGFAIGIFGPLWGLLVWAGMMGLTWVLARMLK